MKKIFLTAITTIAILAFGINSVIATGNENQVATILPQDVVFLASISPDNINTKLAELYDDYATDWFTEMVLTNDFKYSGLDTNTADSLSSILKTAITNNGISLGILDDAAPVYFITIEMTEENYDSMITALGSYAILLEANMYYIDAVDNSKPTTSYFAYKDGYLVISEECTDALNSILATGTDTLASDSKYQEVENEFLGDNFLNTYLDFDYLNEEWLGEASTTDILDAIGSYGISLKQTSSGFKIQAYSSMDSAILESLELDYSQNNAIPSIYTYMPAEDTILYSEIYNLSYVWEELQTLEFDTTAINTSFTEETGLDMEDDALALLQQGVGFLVQSSENTLPTLTMMSDISANPIKASITLQSLTNLLWDYLTVNDTEDIITKNEETLMGGNMTIFTISIPEKESENPYAVDVPEGFLNLKITIGITDDNILLISTNPDIAEQYGENLTNNNSFNTLFDKEGTTTSNVTYFDMDSLTEYIVNTLENFEETTNVEVTDLEAAKDAINNFFSFFHSFYSSSLTTNDSSDYELTLTMDFDDLLNIDTYFWETTSTAETSFQAITNSHKEFEDVQAEEWYGDDVYYLTTQGVVTGYPDGSFGPSNEITRAEFTTMLMRALYNKGYFEDTCANLDDCLWAQNTWNEFSDIEYWDWSAQYIYTARAVGIVQGYEDGTFHPNDPISRAEAVQIISNAFNVVVIKDSIETNTSQPDFEDVKGDDWYQEAVLNSSYYKIVEGTSPETFEPSRPINRAESSKIIKKFLDIVEENNM